MVYAICKACGHRYHWEWIEAFSKFGFNDGDGSVETHRVAFALERAGYAVKVGKWLAHNHIIFEVSKDGVDIMPRVGSGFSFGYDHPHLYLPAEIIELLDEAFPTTSVYKFP